MIEVRLSKIEFFQAVNVGVIRQMQNKAKGRKDRFGAEKMDGWGIHIEGACGEAAVAKYLNIFYNGNIGNLSACDVNNNARNVEVRTAAKNHHSLILHKSDKDDSVYILVCGEAPVFNIKGWVMGRDGKKNEYWKDPTNNRPAFFVPQNALKPMTELNFSNPLKIYYWVY